MRRIFLILSICAASHAPASVACAETVTFAVFGDYGGASKAATEVADLVHSWNPDFIVTTGDNNYGNIAVGSMDWELYVGSRYGDYMKGRSDGKYPSQTSPVQRFFPSVGNHDTESGFVLGDSPAAPGGPIGTGGGVGDKPGYIDYFHTDPGDPDGRLPSGVHSPQHSFYDVRWGPVHLFALDSDRAQAEPASGVEQREWLQARLADSDAPWKFVYFHHAAYSSGPHGSHAMMQWPFAEWGADAVFQGHDHNYERLLVDDFLYFVSGLGGQGTYGFPREAPGSLVRYSETNGAMRVTVDETSVLFEFVALDPFGDPNGTLVDIYELAHPVPEPATAVVLILAAVLVGFHTWRRRRKIG
jgi:tartrate-resistant acid phosphatase type 5